MPKHSALFLAALVLLTACQPEASPESPADAPENYDVFGEAFTPEGAVPVRTVVDEADQYAGQTVKLEGTVYEVCRMAGCWLTVDAGEGRYVRVAVPRHDDGSYVYTVPTDISGRHVVVQGELAAVTLDAETSEHLAEDAGHHEQTMDHHDDEGGDHHDSDHHDDAHMEAGTELHLTAVGVLIQKPTT